MYIYISRIEIINVPFHWYIYRELHTPPPPPPMKTSRIHFTFTYLNVYIRAHRSIYTTLTNLPFNRKVVPKNNLKIWRALIPFTIVRIVSENEYLIRFRCSADFQPIGWTFWSYLNYGSETADHCLLGFDWYYI